jgi:hypothetical protein
MPTRTTLIRGLKRAVLKHVPRSQRADARLLLSTLEDQYAALLGNTETQSYEEGYQAARKKYEPESVKQEAFKVGYVDGCQSALGRVGSPAQERQDEDVTAEPPKIRPC